MGRQVAARHVTRWSPRRGLISQDPYDFLLATRSVSLFLERLSFGSVLHRRFLSGKHPQIPLGVGGTTSTFTNARDYAQREVTLLRDIQELSAPEARRAGSRVRSTR
jgi:hypothetical protein